MMRFVPQHILRMSNAEWEMDAIGGHATWTKTIRQNTYCRTGHGLIGTRSVPYPLKDKVRVDRADDFLPASSAECRTSGGRRDNPAFPIYPITRRDLSILGAMVRQG
jgi:hypothetical protein